VLAFYFEHADRIHAQGVGGVEYKPLFEHLPEHIERRIVRATLGQRVTGDAAQVRPAIPRLPQKLPAR
jgi:hypothetical protein